jgi:CubicO group peptidase (beta-lactamase class C family)
MKSAVKAMLAAVLIAAPASLSSIVMADPPPRSVAADLNSPEFAGYLDGLASGQMAVENVPGLAVAIVTRDGVRIARTYGQGSAAGKPVTIDPQTSVLPIASMSKTFIAMALMKAQEKGLLSLDEPANKYLDFTLPTYPGARPITLRDLARHEAGFEERWLATGAGVKDDPRPWSEIMAKTYPKVIAPPGSWSSYSNYGAALLAYIVERVTKTPYDVFLRQEIFEPIGMTSSSVLDIPPPEIKNRVVVGWQVSDGVVRASTTESVRNKRTAPAGRVKTSLPDMQLYMLTLLNGGLAPNGNRILSETSVKTLLTGLRPVDPAMPAMGVIFAQKDEAGLRFVGHGGDGGDRHTDMLLAPDRGFGLLTIFFSAPGPHARDRFASALVAHLFPDAQTSILPMPTAKPASSFKAFAGQYRHYRWAFTSIEKILGLSSEFAIKDSGKGTLIVKGRLGPGEYVPVAGDPNLFQNRVTHEFMAFRKGWDGATLMTEGTFPFMTAYKLSLIDTQDFSVKAFWSFIAALSGLGVGLIALAGRRAVVGKRLLALGDGLFGAVLLANAWALYTFYNQASAVSEAALQQAIPDFAQPLLAIPVVSSGLVIGYVLGAAQGVFRPKNRLEYLTAGLGVITFVLFALWLAHWNAFGWNFP